MQYNALNTLRGTLAYISPEQTGRTNRLIDYRTDFYSLGITLYELFCARLPFKGSDPLEIVHGHIARQPKAPCELNPQLPAVLSDLILRLMAKDPEQRYQSARGIGYDLKFCLQEFKDQGKISYFALGLKDIQEKFQPAEKLYGRDHHTCGLLHLRAALCLSGLAGRGGFP